VGVARTRRFVGLLSLFALVAIAVGMTGFELPLPRFGAAAPQRAPLPGVREVAANVLLRVGSGAPAGGELGFLAVESTGNLVVTDSRRHTIMRFDPSGHLLNEWGPRFGDTSITEPAGVAVAGDTIYVVDRGTPRIFRLDGSGRLLGIISLETLGTYGLNGMAADLGGNLFVADTGRNRILVFSPNGQQLKQIGRAGNDLGALTQPMMLAFAPDNSFFVADWENVRIQRFDANYEATGTFPTGANPWGVAVDQSGRVFVPEPERHRVLTFTPQGSSLGDLGEPTGQSIDVAPRQVALARADRPSLYVLGSDGIVRVDFENTAPPPQGGPDVDPVSVLVLVLVLLFLVFAIVSRRARRANEADLLRAPLDRPVGLHAENGAEGQHQQPSANEQRIVGHQPESKHEPTDHYHQTEQEAHSHHQRRS
jgi:sugar lactone lactonase YvrE